MWLCGYVSIISLLNCLFEAQRHAVTCELFITSTVVTITSLQQVYNHAPGTIMQIIIFVQIMEEGCFCVTQYMI